MSAVRKASAFYRIPAALVSSAASGWLHDQARARGRGMLLVGAVCRVKMAAALAPQERRLKLLLFRPAAS